jgi:hypothetical protein
VLGRSRRLDGWARKQGSRKIATVRQERERSNHSRRESDRGRRRGMGSTPPRTVLFIGGPRNLSVAVPSTVQNASTDLFREVCEKIKADFSRNKSQLQPKSEFRSLAKKTTSGRPNGKSFCKPPRHINISLWKIISPNRPST